MHRGVDGDIVIAAIDLIRADNAESLGFAVIVFNLDPGAEEGFTVLLRGIVNDLDDFQTLAEKAHPAIDFSQALLVVLVVGILAAIAEAGCQVTFLVTSGRSSFQR